MAFFATDWVDYHAQHRPDALALGCAEDGIRTTWAELEQRVAGLAATLRGLGAGHGDRVALIAENHPRVFEVQFACMRLGALFVPLNWRLHTAEIQEICRDAQPRIIVYDGVWAEVAREVATKAGMPRQLSWDCPQGPIDYEDAIWTARPLRATGEITMDDPTHILYTSGTTGKPKGAISTNSTLVWQALSAAHTTGFSQPGCHHLNPMPLFHAGGLNVMANSILYFGGAVTTMARFDPEQVLQQMLSRQPPITHFAAIPLMYQRIADLPGFSSANLSHLRHGVIAGAVAGPELLQRWADHGFPLQPQYGGTEMGPMATVLDNESANIGVAKKGSTGRAAPHTQIRLVDSAGRDVETGVTGEIWLRGPSITVGYWGQDKAAYFTQDGWFKTGDAAYRDVDGFYYPSGRTKEMFKSGGENVYPAEVEQVLALHPHVHDVAVVGVTDATWGEVGLAVVVPAPGTAVTLDELNAFAAQRLARYKLPKRLSVVDQLPRNVTGKVSRAQLKLDYGSN
ncbi:class I adenylate-forming enzyme family protein [Mycobacterium paraintracellulare]|uniref:class I adenylate-forming enzyme family protein n=1 Tax=Mycobacterium paraintracellulare TaxID=1138383 RepID=UPI0019276FE8|nr:AMP-binding protein [Mycobacterium paraintracellulare]BCP02731.1 acid--CoA ligase [Mycobacterium paraintracellulare]